MSNSQEIEPGKGVEGLYLDSDHSLAFPEMPQRPLSSLLLETFGAHIPKKALLSGCGSAQL